MPVNRSSVTRLADVRVLKIDQEVVSGKMHQIRTCGFVREVLRKLDVRQSTNKWVAREERVSIDLVMNKLKSLKHNRTHIICRGIPLNSLR